MKNMVDLKIEKGNVIILPESIVSHLGITEGENIKALFTEKAIILMRPEVFGEEILKKL